jgi:hypothetical protein
MTFQHLPLPSGTQRRGVWNGLQPDGLAAECHGEVAGGDEVPVERPTGAGAAEAVGASPQVTPIYWTVAAASAAPTRTPVCCRSMTTATIVTTVTMT